MSAPISFPSSIAHAVSLYGGFSAKIERESIKEFLVMWWFWQVMKCEMTVVMELGVTSYIYTCPIDLLPYSITVHILEPLTHHGRY